MSRIIEIVLFLTPFLGLAAWRLLSPTALPPPWLIYGMAGVVVLLLVTLFWLRHFDAQDGNQVYIPAEVQGNRIVEGHPGGAR